ncbi:hypothetical protein CUMW_009060 [Citrus unshiu]|nr:hypothetical protein CUMW_009060 [Citrus unshiu]
MDLMKATCLETRALKSFDAECEVMRGIRSEILLKSLMVTVILPNNVLLNDDMFAHLGDFGMAILLDRVNFVKQTLSLATIGYMAPDDCFWLKF